MKIDEIKEIARRLDIKIDKAEKCDLVRLIQQVEENQQCFGNERVELCRRLSRSGMPALERAV